MSVRERDQSIDILRGIGIFLMVFDHVGWGALVHIYIQSFHMPLFFIVSGYLWKNEELSSLLKKRFRTLMIPYVFFSLLYLALQAALSSGDVNSFLKSLRAVLLYPTDMGNMPLAPALWFLPCMFLTSIAYSFLSQLKLKTKALIILGITSLGMLYSSLSGIMLPFTIEPFAVALEFMLVGELINKNKKIVMSWIDEPRIIVVLLVAEAILAMINNSVDMRSARYHNCILYVLNGVSGTMAYWGVARIISSISENTPWEGIQRISFLSRNAMGFICTNQLFIKVFEMIFQTVEQYGLLAEIVCKSVTFIAVMIVVSWITRMIMSSKFRVIFGGRT